MSRDRNLIAIVLLLFSLIGCLAIYNANYFNASSLYFTTKQFVWILTGLAIYYISSSIHFRWYLKLLIPLNLLFLIPLILLLIFGEKVNGMNGWFITFKDIHPVYLQPAELSKPIYILTICWIAYINKKEFIKSIYMLIYFILWVIPIVLQPDFGTALFYAFGFSIAYWLNSRKKVFIILLCLFSLLFIITFIAYNPYVFTRILSFIFPDYDIQNTGWHSLQLKYSVARGGFNGVGLGKAYWSSAYVPLSHSDSIFATLVESFGVFGTLPIIFGYIAIMFTVYQICRTQYSSFLISFSSTIAACIVFQALLHISVNIGLLPITGITLPMISYGGSSLVSVMLSFGLLASYIERRHHKTTRIKWK